MRTGYLLIESQEFTKFVSTYFASDHDYANFQNSLVLQPDKGTVIPGALPLRKVRWTDSSRGKGKRGGIRIIYIHLPSIQVLCLLDVYDKDEADDLSANDKKLLKQLAEELSQELSRRFK